MSTAASMLLRRAQILASESERLSSTRGRPGVVVVGEEPVAHSKEAAETRAAHLDQVRLSLLAELGHLVADIAREEAELQRLALAAAPPISADDPLVSAMQGEEQKLLGEIHLLQQRLDQTQPTNTALSSIRTRQAMESSNAQLRQLSRQLDHDARSVRVCIDSEQQVTKDVKVIAIALEKKLSAAHASRHQHQPSAASDTTMDTLQALVDDELRRRKDTLRNARAREARIKTALVQFIEQHYPSVYLDVQGRRVNVDDVNDVSSQAVYTECSLGSLVEELMNLSVSSGDGSAMTAIGAGRYMDVADAGRYWRPYVELLVKGGVARLDPENANRVRLVDFSA